MKRFLIILYLFPLLIIGQSVDSLKFVLKNAKHDTTRCQALNMLAEYADENEWPKYNAQLKEIAWKNLNSKSGHEKIYARHFASALNNIGYLADVQGDTKKAFTYYDSSLKVFTEFNNKAGVSICLTNIGNLHQNQGNIQEALEFSLKALKIQEEIELWSAMAATLNNIGLIYNSQDDFEKSLEYYKKSLELEIKTENKSGIASCYHNIGSSYNVQGNTALALKYLKLSLKYSEELSDKEGTINTLISIAKIYSEKGDPLIVSSKELSISEGAKKAMENYERALSLAKEIEYKKGMAVSLTELAEVYLNRNEINKAVSYAQKGMELSKGLGYPLSILNSARTLKMIYRKQNKFKDALEMFELELKMRDSLNNIETQKTAFKQQTDFEYQKKREIADNKHDLELLKQSEIAMEKQKKQKAIIISVVIGLICVITLLFFIFRNLSLVKKQKQLIELKSNEVEEKQKEILDSISYAGRIQRSFLATKEILDENLKDYFIFYKPKDIVSGDFYWANKLNDSNFALVTADSTGHGVPGAIMSLLNITSLEKAIEYTSEPAEILNNTRKNIIERLKKDGSAEGGKDGMDASLICFDFKNRKIKYASANNPIWIVRKTNDNVQLIELKPDKMPVGKHSKESISFSQNEFDFIVGDIIYTFTDGLPDQFGGDKGKKFMSKRLKELLLSNANLSMQDQKKLIEDTFKKWIGNNEQIDDVTLIGIKV